jgi:glycine dehydrogenase subunit 2
MIPECLLIEPTETESKETLDAFIDAMGKILAEARADSATLKGAPYTMPVRRLDDVRAAKQLDITYRA